MIITKEMMADYLIKEVVQKFKSDMNIKLNGEELLESMWENKELLGEIFFNEMLEHVSEDEL